MYSSVESASDSNVSTVVNLLLRWQTPLFCVQNFKVFFFAGRSNVEELIPSRKELFEIRTRVTRCRGRFVQVRFVNELRTAFPVS